MHPVHLTSDVDLGFNFTVQKAPPQPFLWLSKPAEILIHNFLDFIAVFQLFDGSVQVLVESLKGNPVRFGDGPAAVTPPTSFNRTK